MGLNICLYRKADLAEHPTWDWTRLGGDREFAKMLGNLPSIQENWSSFPDVEYRYRPADFAAWREAVASLPNADRFAHLIDILEREPDYWIYVSY